MSIRLRVSDSAMNGETDEIEAVEIDWDGTVSLDQALATLGEEERVEVCVDHVDAPQALVDVVHGLRTRDRKPVLVCSSPARIGAKTIQRLSGSGLASVEVWLYGARSKGHDLTTGHPGSWRAAVTVLRAAVTVGRWSVIVRTPLSDLVLAERAKVAELIALLDSAQWHVYPPLAETQADCSNALPAGKGLGLLWIEANRRGVTLDCVGFSRSVVGARGCVVDGPGLTMDKGLLNLVRRGFHCSTDGGGLPYVNTGHGPALLQACADEVGGLDNLGLELALRGVPIHSLPVCLGGRGQRMEDERKDERIYGGGCGACPLREECPGLQSTIAYQQTDDRALRPVPVWIVPKRSPLFALFPGEGVLERRLLGALGQSLVAKGAVVQDAAPQAQEADCVVVGDVQTAIELMEDQRVSAGCRIVVLDLGDEEGLERLAARWDPNGRRHRGVDWWGDPRVVLVAFDPARVHRYRRLRLPLRQVHWRPWSPLQRAIVPRSLALVHDSPAKVEWPLDEECWLRRLEGARFAVVGNGNALESMRAVALAHAMGRAVVCDKDSWSIYRIRHGVDGWLCDTRDEAEVVIQELCRDGQRMAQLTAGAMASARLTGMDVFAAHLMDGVPANAIPWRPLEQEAG